MVVSSSSSIDGGFRLTEEVVRWRFELALRSTTPWWIAFTNPTAGPWKRVMGRAANGSEGEVYRFSREEDRPDVVAVSDSRKQIMVVEAKDSVASLETAIQVKKSSSVVIELSKALAALDANPFWGERATYSVIAGLLWGREYGGTAANTAGIFALYREHLGDIPLVGFEAVKGDDASLSIVEFAEASKATVIAPIF
jgi:hypothetical protein